jgi:hypothetical protein
MPNVQRSKSLEIQHLLARSAERYRGLAESYAKRALREADWLRRSMLAGMAEGLFVVAEELEKRA